MTATEARDVSESARPADDAVHLAAVLQVIRIWAALGRRCARVPYATGRQNSKDLVSNLRGLGYLVGPISSNHDAILVAW